VRPVPRPRYDPPSLRAALLQSRHLTGSRAVNQILFVDSDPIALNALKTALESQETGWKATFVTSAQAALNLLANRWFDVVFTELRLPGMDVAELLEHVKLHDPWIIRVLLAEPLEDAQLNRAVAV